ncbi:MAG: alpha/beta hydrolase [Rhodospirillaceae bacterium]|nr:alpha/beta hydrolase [Rhodospirillaceae bacterium]
MPTSGQASLATITRAYGKGRFGQIHYRVAGSHGSRSPLLLLHPSPISGYVFENLMGDMGRDRFAVAPDTPGFGMSDPPPSPPEIKDYAEVMLDFVAEQGLGMIDVMGYHTGALTAVEMARQNPDVVRKIVMISATVFTQDETEAFRKQYVPKTADERPAAMAARWPSFKNEFWAMGDNLNRKFNIFLDGQRNPDWSFWGHRAAFNYNIARALQETNHPILILNPEDDLWTYTPRAAPLLKNGRVHDLPGWTHGFLDAETAKVGTILRGFLDH